MLCFRKFLAAKKFMDKKGGVSKFSVENFLYQSAENFRRGNLQSFSNLEYRKNLRFRRLCHDFPSKTFVSECQKFS